MKIDKFNKFKKNINESSEVTGYDNSAMQHNYIKFFDMEREIDSLEIYLEELILKEDQIDKDNIDEDTVERNVNELTSLKLSIESLIEELKDKVKEAILITQMYDK